MIEEVLKNINTNLEKIAAEEKRRNDILEKQYSEKVECETSAAKPLVDGIIKVATQNVQAPQNYATTEAPAVQQAPSPIPTTAVEKTFTYEQIARAMANAISLGKSDIVSTVLSTFGVTNLTAIDSSNYNKIATILESGGVRVE